MGSFEVPGRRLGYPGLGIQRHNTTITMLGPATFRAWSYLADGSPSLGGPFFTSLPVPATREPRWAGTCRWVTGVLGHSECQPTGGKATKSFDGDLVTGS